MIDFCSIKEIQKALNDLEDNFKSEYDICINEASVLCSLSDCCLTSSEIAKCADLRASHTSKTLRTVEDKGLITRKIGTIDRRMMRFSLTQSGQQLLEDMKNEKVMIPEVLRPLLEKKEQLTIKL
ncbi:MAG: winged helix DNA-binding protein [Bacteroidales bacterium]|jgi:DNA-binding MarR family transcriptional regulator|nr:winged helix DNA-binding protein [Bacteroidales bacterium]